MNLFSSRRLSLRPLAWIVASLCGCAPSVFGQDPYSLLESMSTNFGPSVGEFQGKLAFFAYSPSPQYSLWSTDGTAGGTTLLTPPCNFCGANIPWMFELNGELLFERGDFANGFELWKSDGSATNASILFEFQPGTAGGNPMVLGSLPGILLLSVDLPSTGRELWRTDGTAAGTFLVRDIWPGTSGSSPSPFGLDTTVGSANCFAFGNEVYFAANDGAHGRELWATDGTSAGTRLVADINPGPASSSPVLGFQWRPMDPPILGSELFFFADDGTHGEEPWKTDGTSAGTVLVADVNPGPACAFGISCTLSQSFRKLGSQLCFRATDGVHGVELWRTDGSAAGTFMVADLRPGPGDALFSSALVPLGSKLLLSGANDGVHGSEPWVWDGSANPPQMVADLTPGSAGTLGQLQWVDGGVAYGVLIVNGTDYDIWRTDGTASGTFDVTQMHLVDTHVGITLSFLGKVGSRLVFASERLASGLWIYGLDIDGIGTPFCASTVAGTPACPCANVGQYGRGCVNSLAGSPGARLEASGSLVPDTVVLRGTEVMTSALSIFLQGSTASQAGVPFGDGVRCVGGTLKRLYAKNASAGVVSAPQGAEPSVSARSAALGDVIAPGTARHYQVYYRDSNLAFCASPIGNSWNVTSGLTLNW